MEKRLFIGIKIEPSAKLLELYQELKLNLNSEKIKWAANENLHITLKFLGNIDVKTLPQIKEQIRQTVINYHSFEFEINGFGVFKKNEQIRVIWMGINGRDILNSLANQLINDFEELGFHDNEKEFNAHLTLGRVNPSANNAKIQILIDCNTELFIQKVKTDNVVLFESIKTPIGTKYLHLENYSL